jgi:hypothetical protein
VAWAAIWNEGAALPVRYPFAAPADHGSAHDALTLWLEMRVPAPARRPLRLWRGRGDCARALALYLMPDGALRLIHGEIDLSTPKGFLSAGQVLVLRNVICARGRVDVLDVSNAHTGIRYRMRAGLAARARLDDVLPADDRYLRLAVVAAIATHAVPATDLPGLCAGTRVLTDEGVVPVERLAPGHRLIGRDGAARPLRWVAGRDRLCLGQAAPVLLRAPYYGLDRDTCVTPETRLLRRGAEVEYLAGTDEVLVRAGDLVSGQAARLDWSVPLRRFYHLMLDDPDCLRVGRCQIETATLYEVVSSEDVNGMSPNLAERDCHPSLPLLDRPATRSLLGTVASGHGAVI